MLLTISCIDCFLLVCLLKILFVFVFVSLWAIVIRCVCVCKRVQSINLDCRPEQNGNRREKKERERQNAKGKQIIPEAEVQASQTLLTSWCDTSFISCQLPLASQLSLSLSQSVCFLLLLLFYTYQEYLASFCIYFCFNVLIFFSFEYFKRSFSICANDLISDWQLCAFSQLMTCNAMWLVI